MIFVSARICRDRREEDQHDKALAYHIGKTNESDNEQTFTDEYRCQTELEEIPEKKTEKKKH